MLGRETSRDEDCCDHLRSFELQPAGAMGDQIKQSRF